ncbi:LOW QUALITY PROTEIN: prolactin-like [Acanthochromis polyacanthus]|uniref:LOW QUALITY PROTEIN: prolactin-like n=1 Tax=Acanthochromis polyacanthus TaxID=80966 RepID=UPI0022341F5D|nr:LOW QUALITY PROTEIN: prolactin-like [Acanthochromis polyacanthus]
MPHCLVCCPYTGVPELFHVACGTVPTCGYGQAGCQVPSLADLFDRVIQQSSRMHGISSDLHSQFEQYFFPNKNLMGKRKCHTYGILTPDDKENAQRLGREELTGVILMLLGAWNDPLSQLYWSMSQDQNQDFNHYTSNKALEITDMVHELKDGVTKMAEKMKLEGLLGNTVGYVSPESLVTSSAFSFDKRGALDSVDHHGLLYCLRKETPTKSLRTLLESLHPEMHHPSSTGLLMLQ